MIGHDHIALGAITAVIVQTGVAQRQPAGFTGPRDVGSPEVADVGHLRW